MQEILPFKGDRFNLMTTYIHVLCGCNLKQYKHGAHRSNAEELVNQYPVIEVEGTVALCDGGMSFSAV